MRIEKSVLCLVGVLIALPLQAHPGVRDSYGCHPNVAHGTYHCHTGPLAGREFSSKAKMIRAYSEKQRSERPKPRVQSPGY